MKPILLAVTWLVAFLLSCTSSDLGPGDTTGQAPDLILHNAAVYTLDLDNAWAEAVAVRGDEIVAIGGENAVLSLAGTKTSVVDLEGAMVLPGLQDPHLHAIEAGLNRDVCFLEPGLSLAAYERAMRSCAREQAGEAWVRGAGPFANDLLGQEELPIDVLDRAVPGRPALVLDAVGHAVWVNSKALEAIGLDGDSKDPPGGILDRDSRTGRLTGLLLEAAQYLAHDAAALGLDLHDLQDALDAVAKVPCSTAGRIDELTEQVDRLARICEDLSERRQVVLELRSAKAEALAAETSCELARLGEWLDAIESRFQSR